MLTWAVDAELIIEDDYDAEYRYDRAPVPRCTPPPDRIAYAGSKEPGAGTAPGHHPRPDAATWIWWRPSTRATWAARPSRSSCWPGCWNRRSDRHIRLVRARHRARRDALLGALTAGLPTASVTGVAAGLHLLIKLPDGADDVALADELRDAGVLVHPLSWHQRRSGPPGLILGYAAHTRDQLRAAGATIARVAQR